MSSQTLYDRNFACAFLSQISFVLANTAMMAHYARWISFLGGEVDDAGWITGTASIAGLILRPWIGQWIDRYGARTTWLAGYAVFSAGALANLWLQQLGVGIYLCRALLVVGAAIVFSSSLTYVTLQTSAERRAEAIGTLGIAGFIGIFLGPFLAEFILTENRSREEFEFLFIAQVGLLAVAGVLLILVKAPPPKTHPGSIRLTQFVRTCRDYWPGVIVLVQASFGLCITVPFVFLTKFVDDVGLQTGGFSRVSLFFMCYAGFGLTLRIVLRTIPERVGRRKVLLVGAVVMSLGMLSFLTVTPEHSWRIALPALLCGCGHSLMYHTCTALLLESFPAQVRGTGSALSMIAMDVGMISGSQILGEVAFRLGYDALFLIVSSVVLLVGIVYAIASIPVWRERYRQARLKSVA